MKRDTLARQRRRRRDTFLYIEEGGYVGPPLFGHWRKLLLDFAVACARTPDQAAAIRLGAPVTVEAHYWDRKRVLGRPAPAAWRIALRLPWLQPSEDRPYRDGQQLRRWIGATTRLDDMVMACCSLGWPVVDEP